MKYETSTVRTYEESLEKHLSGHAAAGWELFQIIPAARQDRYLPDEFLCVWRKK